MGGYDTQLRAQNAQGCEDWDLYLRIAEYYKFAVVPEILVGYRKPANSMSKNFQIMANSHDLMLKAVAQRYPEVPGLFYRLSKSNFYFYLAHQSDQGGERENTRFWLLEAIKAEWVTPFLRPGFYRLMLSVIWQQPETLNPVPDVVPSISRFSTVSDLRKQQNWKIWLLQNIGNLFDQIMSLWWKMISKGESPSPPFNSPPEWE